MPWKMDDRFIGYPPLNEIVLAAQATAFRNAGTVPQTGFIAPAEDSVWGGGEFIWARANGAIPLKQLCVLTPVFDAPSRSYLFNATAAPATANLGRTLVVAVADVAMASGDLGWFMLSGVAPVSSNATVAADTTCGIAAAGQIGAIVAGRQVLNARVVTAASATVAKTGTGAAGDNVIFVPNTDGLFVGGYMSGTGVGAAAICTFIDPMGTFIRVSVVNSAAIAGTVTMTYNNATLFYNILHMNRPFAQGAIT